MKTKCHKALMKYRTEVDTIERELTEDYMRSEKRLEDKIIPELKEKPSKFFSYARAQDRCHEEIVALKEGEKVVTESEEIVNILATQYCKVFSKHREIVNEKSINEIFDDDGDLNVVNVNIDMIKKAISELRSGSAPGLDGIEADCLKKGGDVIEWWIERLLVRSFKAIRYLMN